MATDLVIEDFKSTCFPVIRQHYKIFEIAQIAKPTMKGTSMLPIEDIKFKPLKLDSFEMGLFERLRAFSTPQFKETRLGNMLIYGDYALRIKS